MPRRSRAGCWPWLVVLCAAAASPSEVPADDGAPCRCMARWQGPVEGCDLREVVSAEGLGPSERGATRQVRRNLGKAASAQRLAKAASLPPGAREQFLATTGACEAVAAERANVTCFPEEHLALDRFCSLDLADDPCSLSEGFIVQGKAWSTGEDARARICGEIDPATLLGDPVQANCRARCWSQGRLRCGSAE